MGTCGAMYVYESRGEQEKWGGIIVDFSLPCMLSSCFSLTQNIN